MADRAYSGNPYQTPVQLRTHASKTEEGQRYRQPARQQPRVDDENPDAWRMPKPHTSAVIYTTPKGNRVIEQGNQRIVVHDNPPPKHRPHWLLLFGISMIAMLLLWMCLSWVTAWWTAHQLDSTYE